MTFQAIALLLLSAGVHAVWNFMSKRSLDKQIFLWLALVVITACLWPLWFVLGGVAQGGWVFVIVSGLIEAVYFLLLGGAYQRGDLSLVYPLARGSAPVFVTGLAFVFLSERLYWGGALGIALIVLGVYTLHLTRFDLQGLLAPFLSLRQTASRLAILTGLATAVALVIDKVGITYTAPLLYLYLTFVLATAVQAPYMLLARRPAVIAEWRANRAAVVAVGLMFTASYTLLLLALSTSKASYVSPVREISVVFGALLGSIVLRERFGRARLTGALLIFLGIMCIGLAR